MSFSDSIGTGGNTSIPGVNDTRSFLESTFLEQRYLRITHPRIKPHPTKDTNLCDRFTDSISTDDQHFKVYLRLKPMKNFPDQEEFYYVPSRKFFVTVKVKKVYNFSHIFDDSNGSQMEIFNHAVRDNLTKFVEGQDFTIMAYGASSSGKTYTLMGNDAEPGIIPRFLEALFARVQVGTLPNYKPQDGNTAINLSSVQKEKEVEIIQNIVKNCHSPNEITTCDSERQNCLDNYRRMIAVLKDEDEIWRPTKKKISQKYDVWVSFAEIYNEKIFDLLREDSTIPNQQPNRLRLVHLTKNRSYIKGIRWVYVRNGEEAFAALDKGRCRLSDVHTNINKRSSHSIFFLKIVQHNSDFSSCGLSTFRLCDLAEYEHSKKIGNEDIKFSKSRMMNSSLHVLEKCLAVLQSQQHDLQSLPPYRESKLTLLLQNALCGNEAIAMMVNINPDPKFFEETQHVLQFASIAEKNVEYIEPKKSEVLRSKSCLANKTSDYSIDNRFQSLSEVLKRHEKDFKDPIEVKEKKVRQKLMSSSMKMNNKNNDDFEIRLKNDRKIHAETHNLEMTRLRKEMNSIITDQKREIEQLTAENHNSKDKIATLERKMTRLRKKMNSIITDQKREIEQLTAENHNSKDKIATLERKMTRLRKEMINIITDQIQENDQLAGENLNFKDTIARLEKKKKQDGNVVSSFEKQNDNSSEYNSILEITKNEEDPQISEDLNEGIKSDKENIPLDIDNLLISEVIEKDNLCVKKEEEERKSMINRPVIIDENHNIGSSKRKLLSRRVLDENAAETVTNKVLNKSPGAICPPKLEKLYFLPTSYRKQKKK